MEQNNIANISSQFYDFIQENYNKSRKTKIVGLVLFLIFVLVAAVGFFIFQNNADIVLPFLAVMAVAIIILLFVVFRRLHILQREYKVTIIPQILRCIDESLSYHVDAGHSKSEFMASEMYNRDIDRYNSSDLIQGTIGQTSIRISNVKAERIEIEYEEDSNGERRKKTKTYTVFDGIYLTLEFNKYFTGKTRLYAGNTLFSRNEAEMGTLFSSYRRIELENPNFNRAFKTITTDEQQARYILTPSFMEKLIALQDKMGVNMGFAFINSNLFIAIERNDFLDITPSKDVYEGIENLYYELKGLADIIEELNLNTRIWNR